MRPIVLRSRAVVEAPAEAAWAFLSVYANDPDWRSGVSRMEQDPPGAVVVGAHTVEHIRVLGRDLLNIAEIVEVTAGEWFSWRVVEGAQARGVRRIEPLDAARCVIHLEKEVVLAAADRLLRPVVAAVLARTERGDARRAARLIEERRTPGP